MSNELNVDTLIEICGGTGELRNLCYNLADKYECIRPDGSINADLLRLRLTTNEVELLSKRFLEETSQQFP